jgi:cobalamin biosynthesis Mg chelatase CobN
MDTPEVISATTAVPTQPAPAVEKAAAVEAEDLPATTATSDSSNPAETVQMDPNAGGLPRDGMTTPDSSTVTFNGLAIAPVYSYKKEASAAATQSAAKSVSSASAKRVGILAIVIVYVLALVL